MGWIGEIIGAGNQATVSGILLLFTVVFIWGLLKGYIEIGPTVKERKEALKTANDALLKATATLAEVEKDLIRLEVEKEYRWTNYEQTPVPSVNKRQRQRRGQS